MGWFSGYIMIIDFGMFFISCRWVNLEFFIFCNVGVFINISI